MEAEQSILAFRSRVDTSLVLYSGRALRGFFFCIEKPHFSEGSACGRSSRYSAVSRSRCPMVCTPPNHTPKTSLLTLVQVTQTPNAEASLWHNVRNENASPCLISIAHFRNKRNTKQTPTYPTKEGRKIRGLIP